VPEVSLAGNHVPELPKPGAGIKLERWRFRRYEHDVFRRTQGLLRFGKAVINKPGVALLNWLIDEELELSPPAFSTLRLSQQWKTRQYVGSSRADFDAAKLFVHAFF